MKPSPNRKVCIFCESNKNISKEHLFGQWLKEIFPRDSTTTHVSTHYRWPNEIKNPGPEGNKEEKQGHVGSKKIRAVCEACNNQWLSRLEKKASSALPPLIFGKRCNILPGGQRLLACWAAKTAMVSEYTHKDGLSIPQSDRSWLMEKEAPPSNWCIWMAAYSGSAWSNLSIYQCRAGLSPTPVPQPSDAPYYVQSTTFGVGRVLFLTISSTSPAVIDHFSNREADGLLQLWPARQRSIIWPPFKQTNDDEAYKLANILETTSVLDRSLDGPKWEFRF